MTTDTFVHSMFDSDRSKQNYLLNDVIFNNGSDLAHLLSSPFDSEGRKKTTCDFLFQLVWFYLCGNELLSGTVQKKGCTTFHWDLLTHISEGFLYMALLLPLFAVGGLSKKFPFFHVKKKASQFSGGCGHSCMHVVEQPESRLYLETPAICIS